MMESRRSSAGESHFGGRSRAVVARRRSKKESGAAAVELALTLPLLLLLVLGALDWGYYFFVTQVVTNATREAARAGSLELDAGQANTQASAAAADYLGRAGLDAARATVSVEITVDSVRVDIQYPAGSLTGFAYVIVPDRAQARAEMRRP